ncbi:hypothetical protein MYU51_019707 [Penicillium brevicompactum]
MGVQRALPNGISQRYSDRMSELFSSGSPEASNMCSPLTIAGSVDEQSNNEGGTSSMDECSDEDDAHGQRAVETSSVVEYGNQFVKPPNTGYLRDPESTIIECMAELEKRVQHVEESLLSQNPWNNEMHRKVAHIMDVVEMMRKDVAALKEKVGMI